MMSKTFQHVIAFFSLAIAILACAVPVPPVSQPTLDSITATPPASPDTNQIGTVVALTLSALAPTESSPTAAATVPATSVIRGTTTSLPHSLYYLAPDNTGLTQVFRIEQDGITRHQVTSELVSVKDYDVSPVDGSVVFIKSNDLVYVTSTGTDRRILMYGEPVDQNNPFMNMVRKPVFAPNGQTIAYEYKGLRIQSLSSDKSPVLLWNQVDARDNGLFVPKELYSPERYSPDGTKLLITLGYYEGASSALYDPATKALTRLEASDGGSAYCDKVAWSADSSSMYADCSTMGMLQPDFGRVDAAGKVTTLIQGQAGDGNYNIVDHAYLAPDGQLYFFFATAPVSEAQGAITRSPLQLVRAASDGVTGRTVLSQEDFHLLNEVLWAPDASFVVAVIAPSEEIYQGGQAEIVYLDGRPKILLAPFAQQIKWGP